MEFPSLYCHYFTSSAAYASSILSKISAEQDARHAAKSALQVALADAMAYNASQTLDGQHGDNHPAQDFLGKVLTHCLTLNHWYYEKSFKGRTERRACRFEFGSTLADIIPSIVYWISRLPASVISN